MGFKEDRAASLKAAQDIIDGAKDRDLTAEESAKVEEHLAEVKSYDEKAALAAKSAEQRKAIAGLDPEEPTPKVEEKKAARDLGEHFVKSGMAESLKSARQGGSRFQVSSPEFKAATDPFLTGDVSGGLATQYQQGVLETRYRELTIADLLAKGTLSQPTLTYWQQGTLTGDVATVAEGATKPSLNFDAGIVTETLAKIAGVTKISDEMVEDADFMVSMVRSQLLQRLSLVEEDQILNGNGTAPNLSGILDRSGIQTYATTAGLTAAKALNGIFHAIQLVKNVSFIPADGIVMNPTDYETVRLGLDANNQYYGGGPFTGAYGNDGFSLQPGLWTLPTVVTPAIAQGTVLVGAFRQGAQLFRKGGVRLESTNSNEDDFKKNLVALRVEERVALAVYFPTAFVKVPRTAS
jgi:HK97 family phage major capsid protein